jgi:glycosyltransferase involved in cell wall biosynthesis
MSDALHRIWQVLPQRRRRRVLLATTSGLAPKCPRHARRAEPVIIAGFFAAASGLGELARLLHDAYVRRGIEVYGIDLTQSFRQGADVQFGFTDGRAHRGPGTIILVVNAPFVPLALLILGRRFLEHKWRVGYWAWELPALPPEWSAGAEFVNEIWAISGYSARAMEAGLGRPVHVVLPPIAAPAMALRAAAAGCPLQSSADFVVLVAFNMASSFARKNPLAAIAAYQEAFGHDPGTLLLVKIAHPKAYPAGARAIADACRGYRNIEVLDSLYSSDALVRLLAGADVLLSLHRAEGLGLLFAQAMHLGKSIVATGWSGNLEILNSDNAWLVPAALVRARDPQGTYDWPDMQWADPSVPDAARILRQIRSQPALRDQKGEQAQADARRSFDHSRIPAFLHHVDAA